MKLRDCKKRDRGTCGTEAGTIFIGLGEYENIKGLYVETGITKLIPIITTHSAIYIGGGAGRTGGG